MKLVFWVFLLMNLFGCNAISNTHQRPSIDVKLIGVWEGKYTEPSGTVKSWTQTRKADGSYFIEFSYTELNGTKKHFTESGRWWIKDGLFHELASSDMEQPDKYQYQFKQLDCVNFALVDSAELPEGLESYEFSECLVKDGPVVSAGETTKIPVITSKMVAGI